MLKLYNSLTRKKEEIDHNKEVKMYSCGPTVYYYPHIGNMRAYLFMDNLRRVIKYNNVPLKGVMNITDVGHLTSDEDEGDDKMLVASQRENKSPWEIAKFYTDVFMKEAKRLNLDMPEIICPATSVIPETLDFVKGLMEKGYAYETSKGIYFDISKFKEYGRLSGKKINQNIAGARIDVDEEKRNPEDFSLWVKAPKNHIMQWESPWGMGYPGWHIECSTIGKKFLGDKIDIHTGGVDHRPIHHENEIAQSDSLEGHRVVDKWMHLEFIQIDGGKMSKSLNNIYTLDTLIERGFSPEDYRYFYFMAHYSKQQNFTFDALLTAKNSLKTMKNLTAEHKKSNEMLENEEIVQLENEFLNAINDDLNMPNALSVVWKMLRGKKARNAYETLIKFNKVLGFEFEEFIEIPKEIEDIAKQRWQARLNKDWAKSDELRNCLAEKGWIVKDSKESYSLSKI